jgi:hypothetical protein
MALTDSISNDLLSFPLVLVLSSAGKFCAICRNHAALSLMIPFVNLDREQRVSIRTLNSIRFIA